MSKNVINQNITKEMQTSFLDYAMSVIVSRALPDVRDGLKPVHRRILFAMSELGNTPDKPYKKSARIVGDVIGKYHPHGDSSVYEAMVRMAQEFSYRLELVDGHGNFGSLDGDGAAAMRYTEARMAKVALELLRDINKNTIDYQENYDGSENEPKVLPAKFPNILVNGASGIAVGMATNIPPHNLNEVIDGAIAVLENNDITIDQLIDIIKGPDLPLGAQILGNQGIIKAYHTGNGSIKIRSKYEVVEQKNGKTMLVFTEIPFQVNKALMIERIADNIRNKVIDGITDLRDESDRDGVRVVMELRRDVTTEVVINNLFKHSQLEVSFAINLLALVNGSPKVLNLKEILIHYLDHQIEVITRRTEFDLEKAAKRAHILEGLKIAVDNIDRVITIIRQSSNRETAMKSLISEFTFSEEQTKAILEMRLQKLTGLEVGKIETELEELQILIIDLKDILAKPERIKLIIKEEMTGIKEKFGTPRRTEIVYDYIESDMDYERLIEEKEVLLTLTRGGYIKRMPLDAIKSQNRGGRGTKGMSLNEDDEISQILSASTHSDLLFFTDTGKVFKTRTFKVPEYASKSVKGLPLINLINIEKEDRITTILSIKEYDDESSLFFATKNGIGKKTKLTEYQRINRNGKKAITLEENDELIGVDVTTETNQIFFATKAGLALQAESISFRNLGRGSRGVKSIRFKTEEDEVIGFGVVSSDNSVISVTENGFGKMTDVSDYRIQARGGKGVRNLKISEKTGKVVKIAIVNKELKDKQDLIILTQQGQSIRTGLEAFRMMGRNTQGVKLIKLQIEDCVKALEIMNQEPEKVETIQEDEKVETNEQK